MSNNDIEKWLNHIARIIRKHICRRKAGIQNQPKQHVRCAARCTMYWKIILSHPIRPRSANGCRRIHRSKG